MSPTSTPHQQRPSRPNVAIFFANLMLLGFAGLLAWLSYRAGTDESARTVNYLVCTLGLAVGWAIGFLAAPLNVIDETRFAAFGKLLSAFLTGYVISKLDRFFDRAFFNQDALAEHAWIRLALFSTATLAMAITVYVNRAYLHTRANTADDSRTANSLPAAG